MSYKKEKEEYNKKTHEHYNHDFTIIPGQNPNHRSHHSIPIITLTQTVLQQTLPQQQQQPQQQEQSIYTVKTIEGYEEMGVVNFNTAISQHIKYIQSLTERIKVISLRVGELNDANSLGIFDNPKEYDDYLSSKIILDRIEKKKSKKELKEEEKRRIKKETIIECRKQANEVGQSSQSEARPCLRQGQSKENQSTEFKGFIMENRSYFMRCKKYLNDNNIAYTEYNGEDFDFEEDQTLSSSTTIVTEQERKKAQTKKFTVSVIENINGPYNLKIIYDFMQKIIIYAHKHHNGRLVENIIAEGRIPGLRSDEEERKCQGKYYNSDEHWRAHLNNYQTKNCEVKAIWKTDNVNFLKDLDLDTGEPLGYVICYQ
jgi:hypothetical protein